MKFNPQEIRGAMDSRLSALHENGARCTRIRQKIRNESENGRKQKTSAWIALTAVTALVVAGIALTAGLNLFGVCGNEDVRVTGTAAPTAISARSLPGEGNGTGNAQAYITNVSYIDNSLFVAYTIENCIWLEPFTPTDDQLAQMRKVEGGIPAILDDNPDDPLQQQFHSAVESGTPFGVIHNTLMATDFTDADSSANVGTADQSESEIKDGTLYASRKYNSLHFAREYMNIEIRVWTNIVYLYFDGTDIYSMYAPLEDSGAMTAAVQRIDTQTRQLSGMGYYMPDVMGPVHAKVSADRLEITMTAYGAGFTGPDKEINRLLEISGKAGPEPVSGSWFEVMVSDKDHNLLKASGYTQKDTHTMTAVFDDIENLPDTVTALLVIENENIEGWAIPIELAPVPDPVYVSNWRELSAAAQAGETNVVITADITRGDDEDTIVFTNAVSLRSVRGEHYTLDGNGRQILCVQGTMETLPLREETLICDLTFINGDASDGSADISGGGIGGAVFVQGLLRMESCVFENNKAVGGTLGVVGDALLTGCWFTDNYAPEGGGLYIRSGTAAVNRCTFNGNRADSGGAVFAKNATLTMADCTLSDNAAITGGGGICAHWSTLTLTECTLNGNITEDIGGAIVSHTSTVVLGENSVLSGNQAGTGGGIYANGETFVLSGGEILNNIAGDGGGVCLENSSMEIISGTIRGNIAVTGGGIFAMNSPLSIQGGSITQNIADEIGGGIYLIDSAMSNEAGEISGNTPEDVVGK